jgi:acetyltransferase-like isoleucine patch superfamily enzyme
LELAAELGQRLNRQQLPTAIPAFGAEIGAMDDWHADSSHSFICAGVTIEDEVFIGHGVMFINDRFPRATTDTGELQRRSDWQLEPTKVRLRAAIGSNATILCGVTIGEGATIGAGAVVTRNVPTSAVMAGVPARIMGYKPNGS